MLPVGGNGQLWAMPSCKSNFIAQVPPWIWSMLNDRHSLFVRAAGKQKTDVEQKQRNRSGHEIVTNPSKYVAFPAGHFFPGRMSFFLMYLFDGKSCHLFLALIRFASHDQDKCFRTNCLLFTRSNKWFIFTYIKTSFFLHWK